MYASREFNLGQVPIEECKSGEVERVIAYAKESSKENCSIVNVVNLNEDEIVATFESGIKTFPCPIASIPAQLRAALAAQSLTLYGASQIVGAETDEALKTVHYRLTQYTSDSPPKSIAQLEELCTALGLTITIE